MYLAYLCYVTGLDRQKGGAAQQQLSVQIATALLAGPEQVRSATPADWNTMASGLAPGLAPETIATWVTKLRGAYVDDPTVFGALTWSDLQNLCGALGSLKDNKVQVLAKWMDASNAWQSLKPQELSQLGAVLAWSPDMGGGERSRLETFLTASRAADLAQAPLKDLPAWADLADSAKLSAQTRKAWADKVMAVYGGGSSSLLSLSIRDVESLCDFLGRMGDARAPLLAARYVTGGQTWQAAGSLDDVKRLAKLLAGPGDRVRAARKLLITQIASNFLADKAKTVAASPWTWRDIVEAFKDDLSTDTRASWISQLKGAYLPTPDAATAMTAGDLKGLVACFMGLDRKEAGALAMTRLADPNLRAALATKDSLDLAWWALEAGAPGTPERHRGSEQEVAGGRCPETRRHQSSDADLDVLAPRSVAREGPELAHGSLWRQGRQRRCPEQCRSGDPVVPG